MGETAKNPQSDYSVSRPRFETDITRIRSRNANHLPRCRVYVHAMHHGTDLWKYSIGKWRGLNAIAEVFVTVVYV